MNKTSAKPEWTQHAILEKKNKDYKYTNQSKNHLTNLKCDCTSHRSKLKEEETKEWNKSRNEKRLRGKSHWV